MLSKTLVLTQRGLRRDARVLTHHLLRIAVLGIVFLAVFGAHLSSATVGAPGLGFFSWIAYTTLIFATVAGATFFATAITEEKEEQTLGLLTLANIRPAALIAGKFFPRLFSAVAILTVALPFTLLAITLGGVTWNQVWAAYWTLLAHVVFMGSIGLFFSVLCRTSGVAITWSILAMLVYFAVPPILAQMPPSTGMPATAPLPARMLAGAIMNLYEASAFVRISEILKTGFAEGAFGVQVVGNLGCCAALLLLSWVLFRGFNKDTDVDTQPLPALDRALRFGRGSRRSWSRPLLWKDFHYTAGGWEWIVVRMALYVVLSGGAALIANDLQIDFELRKSLGYTLVVMMMLVAVPVELTVLAARLFRAEIKDGTWPTLVVLPNRIGTIAAGKFAGGMLGVAPALGLAAAGVAIAPDAFAESLMSSSTFAQVVSGYLFYFALFLVFLHLTTLYSIIFNAWGGVLLAVVTMWVGFCFTGPLFMLPFMLISNVSGTASEWLGIAVGISIYGAAFMGICFGLEVLIIQQLRNAAAR